MSGPDIALVALFAAIGVYNVLMYLARRTMKDARPPK